jgi:hypothetical protein
MTVCRTLLLAALIVATPILASAQIGGGQGELPGGAWTVPSAQPSAPSPACQQLQTLREQVQKHGMSIQKASERKAPVQDGCKLFKIFLATEAQFIRVLEDNSRTCGVLPDAIKRAREGHAKALQVGKQVCDAAAQGSRPAGPTGDFWWIGEFDRNSGQFRDDGDSCDICGKAGDFGLPLPRR